jgi:hypothetical protein
MVMMPGTGGGWTEVLAGSEDGCGSLSDDIWAREGTADALVVGTAPGVVVVALLDVMDRRSGVGEEDSLEQGCEGGAVAGAAAGAAGTAGSAVLARVVMLAGVVGREDVTEAGPSCTWLKGGARC